MNFTNPSFQKLKSQTVKSNLLIDTKKSATNKISESKNYQSQGYKYGIQTYQ